MKAPVYQMVEAERIAKRVHQGQLDKGGHDYIDHVERVVGLVVRQQSVPTYDHCTVAWLHDVVEDTDVTLADLSREFSSHIVDAVDLLTRNREWTYEQYIEQLRSSGNRLAIAVKIADLTDHLERTDPAAEHLVPRYRKALEALR